jgi:dynein heavy chain, axonemal
MPQQLGTPGASLLITPIHLKADLDKALPALDEAVSSLKSLSKNDIVEVKSMTNPPAGVKMVMDAACIMFDLKGKKIPDPNGGPGAAKITDYWDDAKKILNDPGKFLNSLMTYDKENIPPVGTMLSCLHGMLPH